MKNKGLYVSQKDIRRYELLEKVLDESLTLAVAAAALGVSYRQALRLKARVKAYGLEGPAQIVTQAGGPAPIQWTPRMQG